MKETSFIINLSRGPVINEEDLEMALENKMIAGAGLSFSKQQIDSGAVPVRRSRSLRGRGRLMNLQCITPTTFVSDFVLLRTPAVGVRRCLSFSPLFFDCYVILISSNTWTL